MRMNGYQIVVFATFAESCTLLIDNVPRRLNHLEDEKIWLADIAPAHLDDSCPGAEFPENTRPSWQAAVHFAKAISTPC